jgi:hypothetical protein
MKGTTTAVSKVPDATALKNPVVSFRRSFRTALFNILAPDTSNTIKTSFLL